MDLMVQKSIRELVQDVQEIQARLDNLEKDRKNWARNREENDLSDIMEILQQLESDISILQADCVISMTQYFDGKSDYDVFDILHGIFGILNTLFKDVKTMKKELKKSYIQASDLAQIKIDWGRFRKTISSIEKYI